MIITNLALCTSLVMTITCYPVRPCRMNIILTGVSCFFLIESISLLKWAKSEENLALQDIFSKVFEVSSMWTSSWRDFNQEVTFDETGLNNLQSLFIL